MTVDPKADNAYGIERKLKVAAPVTPSETLKLWIRYRTAELNYENAHRVVSPLGGGNVNAGERQKIIAVTLDELDRLADWLDSGSVEFTPPLTKEQLKEWRFARDHGADVPPHILAQLLWLTK